MQRQKSLNLISVVVCVCGAFVLAGCQYLNNMRDCPCYQAVNRSQNYVETILDATRLKIKLEMWDFNYSYSGVNKLEDLVMESGGSPVRSLIVSTMRSGSSFLGALLNAMPSNFYHFEPLMNYFEDDDLQIRKQPDINKATLVIKNLLKCNFISMEENFNRTLMTFGTQLDEYFGKNTRLWESCKYKQELCADTNFTADFCRLFPFQNMKVLRLRLRFIENVMHDQELNVKVVLLVRDPRGVMQSRKHVEFCKHPDCTNPELLCSDMTSDYEAANHLLQKYPDRLMVLRFEDLILNLNATTHKLLKFLRLEPNQLIDEFLLTHTNVQKGNDYSTFRVSHDVVFKWKTRLEFNYVSKLQDVCKEAMDLWGYQLAESASHMTSEDFYPLKPYSMNFTEQDAHLVIPVV